MEKKSIQIGDFIKVRSNGERFWCIVEGFGDEGVVAKVNNHVVMQNFSFGDNIAVQLEDVIEVISQSEKPHPLKFDVTTEGDSIFLTFNQPLKWLGLTPEGAMELGNKLIDKATELTPPTEKGE